MARLPDPARAQWWRECISQQPDSGLSIAAFCDHHQISTTSFYAWRRRLPDEEPAIAGFVSVEVVDSERTREPFRIHLAGGTLVEIPVGQSSVLLDVVEQLRHAGEGGVS